MIQEKSLGIVATSAAAALIVGVVLWPVAAETAPGSKRAAPAPAQRAEQVKKETPAMNCELAAAVAHGDVKAEFKGNGREKLLVSLRNNSDHALCLRVVQGQRFDSGKNAVIVTRARVINLPAQSTKTEELQTAAIRSSNTISEQSYALSEETSANLDSLLLYLQKHPEISVGAIQTAVLALTEKLPLSAFAKFTPLAGDLPSRFDTTAFKVEVCEIVSALLALRDVGFSDDELALTVDPQLRIESMIDPLAHALAMRYYNITAETEWEYWKHELTQGDPSMRHYALYGIARFYPEVALQMLPNWAREKKANTVYRLSALHALAETQKPQALSVLRQLEHDLSEENDLSQAARKTAAIIEKRLNKTAGNKIAFRVSNSLSQL